MLITFSILIFHCITQWNIFGLHQRYLSKRRNFPLNLVPSFLPGHPDAWSQPLFRSLAYGVHLPEKWRLQSLFGDRLRMTTDQSNLRRKLSNFGPCLVESFAFSPSEVHQRMRSSYKSKGDNISSLSGSHPSQPNVGEREEESNSEDVNVVRIQRGDSPATSFSNNTTSEDLHDREQKKAISSIEIDVSNVNEADMLLACRAYLLRKHKLEWAGKKRRMDEAASLINSGSYFWNNPEELVYLNSNLDSTYLVEDENETSLDEGPFFPEEDMFITSAGPFSTRPTEPSLEHQRRSKPKLKLWKNSTWKEQWYRKRWGGRVITPTEKRDRQRDSRLGEIPSSILNSPQLASMSDDEVKEAIITYTLSNKRKSEASKRNKTKKQRRREELLAWKRNIKEASESSYNTTRLRNNTKKEPFSRTTLSFETSATEMQELRAKRAEKSRRAFQTRLANRKANATSANITKLLYSHYNNEGEEEFRISPMKALLRIDRSLDKNEIPSPVDVETILIPGRLGRRRAVLRRILSECFDLRGKCVPKLGQYPMTKSMNEPIDDSLKSNSTSLRNKYDLMFATKCTIEELGSFVLKKLRDEEGNI